MPATGNRRPASRTMTLGGFAVVSERVIAAAGAYAREVVRKPDTPTADSVLAAAEAASPVEAVEAVTRELGRRSAPRRSPSSSPTSPGAPWCGSRTSSCARRRAPRSAPLAPRRAARRRGVRDGAAVRRRAGGAGGAHPAGAGPGAEPRVRSPAVPDVAGAGPGDRARGGHRAPGADAARRAGRRSRGARSPSWRTCWRSWSSPTGGTPTCTSGGSAPAVEPVRGDPAPAAARAPDLRGRGLHARGLAGARGGHRRRHVRLQPGPRPAAPVDDRRDGSRRGGRADRDPVRRAACATPATRARRCWSRSPRPTRPWPSTPPTAGSRTS